MRLKRNIALGVRQQACVVIAAVALSWLSLRVAIGLPSRYAQSVLDGILGVCPIRDVVLGVCPIVALVFTGSLWWTYLHSTREYGGWVAAATLAVIIPCFVFVVVWLAFILEQLANEKADAHEPPPCRCDLDATGSSSVGLAANARFRRPSVIGTVDTRHPMNVFTKGQPTRSVTSGGVSFAAIVYAGIALLLFVVAGGAWHRGWVQEHLRQPVLEKPIRFQEGFAFTSSFFVRYPWAHWVEVVCPKSNSTQLNNRAEFSYIQAALKRQLPVTFTVTCDGRIVAEGDSPGVSAVFAATEVTRLMSWFKGETGSRVTSCPFGPSVRCQHLMRPNRWCASVLPIGLKNIRSKCCFRIQEPVVLLA